MTSHKPRFFYRADSYVAVHAGAATEPMVIRYEEKDGVGPVAGTIWGRSCPECGWIRL